MVFDFEYKRCQLTIKENKEKEKYNKQARTENVQIQEEDDES